MSRFSKKHLLFLFLILFATIQLVLVLLSDTVYGYGGNDNTGHFQIARYSFKYPKLLLDLWGKPVFTALSAPFAQFGYSAAKIFNIIAAVLTLFISAKTAEKLFPKSSLFTVVFIAFAPVYFLLSTSFLTEILFSLILVAAVYLFVTNRFLFSAAVISFLPFIRSEGIVILPVFALAFILNRSYRSLPFLFSGSLFYSITGYFVFGDFLWFIHNQPYSLGESIYGSGSLFHFVKHSHSIFGIPLLILIVFGGIYWFISILKNFSLQNRNTILFILIAGSWIVYFTAHSFVWWRGTGGSLGLTRVIGGIIPLAALTGMKTFEFISGKLKEKISAYTIFSILALLQILLFFTQNSLFLNADPTEQIIKKAAAYIKIEKSEKKVFYFNPLLIHFLETDPYNISLCNQWIADRQQPSNSMEWGDLLVWDAHIGPNEGEVQLENLENDPYLKKVKAFYPLEKVVVLGGYDYSVQIYEKSEEKNDSIIVSDTYKQVRSFENYLDERVKEVDNFKVWELDSNQEYSPGITIRPDVLIRHDIIEAAVTLNYMALEPTGPDEVLLVFSVENNGQSLRYEKTDLISGGNNWEQIQLNIKMPANIPASSKISVYVWNKDLKHLLIEKLTVEMKSY